MSNEETTTAKTAERQAVADTKSTINVALIVVIALSIVAVVMSVLVYSSVHTLQDNANDRARQDQADAQREQRAECIRDINNEVNDKRWTAIARIFEAQGDDAKQEPQVRILLSTVDSAVAKRITEECPPPVTERSP